MKVVFIYGDGPKGCHDASAALFAIVSVSAGFRTDCCFSPDDKLLVTGTSVRKGEGNGKLVFFDRGTFQKVYEIEVTNAVSTHPHPLTYKRTQKLCGFFNMVKKS